MRGLSSITCLAGSRVISQSRLSYNTLICQIKLFSRARSQKLTGGTRPARRRGNQPDGLRGFARKAAKMVLLLLGYGHGNRTASRLEADLGRARVPLFFCGHVCVALR